jgi:hypothetical protein
VYSACAGYHGIIHLHLESSKWQWKDQPFVGWHKYMKSERFLAEVFSDQPWLLATQIIQAREMQSLRTSRSNPAQHQSYSSETVLGRLYV